MPRCCARAAPAARTRSRACGQPGAETACGRETAHVMGESALAAYTSGHEPGAPTDGSLLRPRQDHHREVEHACLQPRVPGRRADLARSGAAVGVRPVRLPRRRGRPRPDGEDAAVHVAAVRRLGRRDGQGDRRRHAAQHRRPPGVRRGGQPDRGPPPRRPRRHHRLDERLRGRRAHRRDARRRQGDRDPDGGRATASTPATSASTPTPRTRRPPSATSPPRRGYDLERSYAYSDSVTDVHMLEAVGHPHAVNPDKDLRRIARDRGWPILVFDKPVALRSRVQACHRPARPSRRSPIGGVAAIGRGRLAQPQAASRRGLKSQGLCSSGPRRTQDTTTPQTHTVAVPTRRSTLPTGRWSDPDLPGATVRQCTPGSQSRVSSGIEISQTSSGGVRCRSSVRTASQRAAGSPRRPSSAPRRRRAATSAARSSPPSR